MFKSKKASEAESWARDRGVGNEVSEAIWGGLDWSAGAGSAAPNGRRGVLENVSEGVQLAAVQKNNVQSGNNVANRNED